MSEKRPYNRNQDVRQNREERDRMSAGEALIGQGKQVLGQAMLDAKPKVK